MKKISFYSMMMENGAKKAVLHNGYTDGVFNYYNNDGRWEAIHILCGLGVGTGNTRKAAQKSALKKDFSKVNDEYMKTCIDTFNHYVNIAMEE